jgi:hypothetical protein
VAAAAPDATATASPFAVQADAKAVPATPAHRYELARILHRTPLRDGPGGDVLSRVRTTTEFGSPTILGVKRHRGRWLKVLTPVLPNYHHGWIRARAATVHGTDYDIRVDRAAHEAHFRRDGKTLLTFPVAVGRPGNETPLGRFAVTDKLRTTDASSPYGCCALALSGHQTRLEPGWPGGDRLAIHGTPSVETIGQAVSLGCMRAPADALHKLLRRMPVGAPVFIRRS